MTIRFRIYLLIVILNFGLSAFSLPVLADDTTPKNATVSATATVPSQNVVGDTDAPTIPLLLRPTDGTRTADPRPEFVWRQSSDPNGNTIFYTLYQNGVATYLGVTNLGNGSGSNYTSRIESGEVRLLPRNGLPDGEYDWYVTATDLAGNTSHSATWHFTVDTTAPYLLLTDIDTYHNLALDSRVADSVSDNTSFEVRGPKDIYFTIHSEPNSTISLHITSTSLSFDKTLSFPIPSSGIAYPYIHLTPGLYDIELVVYDRVGLTAILPIFQLQVTQSLISLPFPSIPGVLTTPSLPYTTLTIPTLPATIYLVTTSPYIALLIVGLLALLILILLIYLISRRPNILILDPHTHKPYRSIIVYHSIPSTRRHGTILTRHEPLLYKLYRRDRGLAYIHHLGRYSTLTIRIQDATHILSLSRSLRFYTLYL